jgi:beta-lactamase superfamily II metal-dependent hydrolase
MKLTIFPSGPGDCLLLEGKDKKRMLIDGGERYRDVVAPHLEKLDRIDVVCVSHDDGDHIKGVLQLFEDMKAWIVHDFQSGNPNSKAKPPKVPRPPEVLDVWHNAFHDLLPDDFKPTFDAVDHSLAIMSAIPQSERGPIPGTIDEDGAPISLAEVLDHHAFFVQSQKQSHELSRLVGRNLLKIRVNDPADGQILRTDVFESLPLGGMEFNLLGPRPRDIEKLHGLYKAWLENNQAVLDDIRRKTAEAAELLRNGEFADVAEPLLAQATTLGRRTKVTPPNHASIMFWVEEDGKPGILLTGDGHHAAIIETLIEHELMDDAEDSHFHVPVLKVPHHGSEHNVDKAFCQRVTADHYVFCGNGSHHNPDERIVEHFVRERVNQVKAPKPTVDKPFHIWFSAHHTTANTDNRRKQMKKIEALVAKLAKDEDVGGLFVSHFLTKDLLDAGEFPQITI